MLHIWYLLAGMILLFFSLLLYILYDNRRVVVARETVLIPGWPRAFEGFTILQLSDLHDRCFGRQQQKLLQLIHSLDYDLAAFTGDMVARDPAPFFTILEGLKNRDALFFARGNYDPIDFVPADGEPTAFGRALQERGCRLMNTMHPIRRGGDAIWITGMMNRHTLELKLSDVQEEIAAAHDAQTSQRLKREEHYLLGRLALLQGIRPGEPVIALVHYPLTRRFLQRAPFFDLPSYVLILAGHYHGGQVRMPFYGPLYGPDAGSGRRGFLPPRDMVEGLNRCGAYQQYISRGLGASGPVKLFRFRLFNPPEINLLVIKRGGGGPDGGA